MRRRDYPGWRIVWALAVTETVSYGVLYYAFAAFLPAMQQHLAGSQTTLAGAFSLSVLVTGAGAIPAGVWLDRHGARGLMTAGSVLAAGLVLLWAHVDSTLALYLTFTGIGLAGAAVLYEPAYATVNAYFDTERRNALLALTMVAGLASTIFVPASSLRGRRELYYRGRSPALPGAFVADGGPPGTILQYLHTTNTKFTIFLHTKQI